MDIYSFLSYLAAFSSIGWRFSCFTEIPSFVHRTFAGGNDAPGGAGRVDRVSFQKISYVEVIPWQHYQLIPCALALAVWLVFSLSFAGPITWSSWPDGNGLILVSLSSLEFR